jgi:hypothetical protein
MPQSQAPNPQALPDTLPANYDFSQGQPQAAPQGQTQAPNPQALPDTLPADYDFNKQPDRVDPRQTGEITNDVGQKVIVPKDGESFSDTMRRAVAYHKSLTPEQQKAALDAEAKTIPAKAVEAGIGGPLAAVGSYAAGAMGIAGAGAVADALPSVLMHTVEGVKALNAWAIKNPVQAILLYHAVKELLPGAKKTMGFIKSVPTPPVE